MAAHPALAPRRAALALVTAVTADRRLLSEALPGALADLGPADRARAQRLATGALRFADRADRLLGVHLRRRPAEPVLNALRLGCYEIGALGEAPHGVVSSLVTLMRESRRTRAQAGLVNAVLRRIGAAGPAAWQAAPPPRLPRWLRRPLIAAHGRPAVAAIEAAHAAGAGLDLTPRDGDAAALAARTGGTVLPSGSVRLAAGVQVTALPGYAEGAFWVQDAAAAIPARMLAPRPGERILDLCAAPGGKTLQLAAAGAEVTALDIAAARLARLEANLARCGLTARSILADALDLAPADYDAVLLDAPCSGTGTIRRHPDLPHARDGSGFPALFDLQARLIDRALAALRPGGRLVFCTCSLLPEEGEDQLRGALARHRDLRVEPAAPAGLDPAWTGPGGGLRLRPDHWPDLGGMDGFFAVALRKPGGGAAGRIGHDNAGRAP